LERRGGFRTLRYMLNERKALFACGTYLRITTHSDSHMGTDRN
jgi:hypothetical protein